jgi:hypothetical protein
LYSPTFRIFPSLGGSLSRFTDSNHIHAHGRRLVPLGQRLPLGDSERSLRRVTGATCRCWLLMAAEWPSIGRSKAPEGGSSGGGRLAAKGSARTPKRRRSAISVPKRSSKGTSRSGATSSRSTSSKRRRSRRRRHAGGRAKHGRSTGQRCSQ